MSKKIFKRILSMTLIATLLIQILPATAKGAEIETTATSELSITQQTGLSDIYEYQTYDAGRAGTINVNTYTGKMHLRRTDMSLSGERMPMEVTFYFDAVNGILDSPYGNSGRIYTTRLYTFKERFISIKTKTEPICTSKILERLPRMDCRYGQSRPPMESVIRELCSIDLRM